mmetsp:Transcript_32383/g.85456  ORF Transcript_32383/g.85456 Transcript_32383/m.85456 type:complete len:151 (+) Transcript_32383:154-606(+)
MRPRNRSRLTGGLRTPRASSPVSGVVLLLFILGATIIKHAIGARNLDSAVATAAPTASGHCRWHSDRLKLRLLMDGCSHSRSARLFYMYSSFTSPSCAHVVRDRRRACGASGGLPINGAAFVAATMSGWAAGLAQWRRREYNRHWRTVTL